MLKEERELNDEVIYRAERWMDRNLGNELSEKEYRDLIREMREKIQDEQGYWECI